MSKLKSRDIVINKEQPYLNDVLDRKDSGDALTNFILNAQESLVLSIDAPWGEGKTTFLRMWEQSLKNDGFPTVYFNAWENDFSDDALTCLIGEVKSVIDEKQDNSVAQQALDKVINTSGGLLKRALPLLVKAGTLNVIDSTEYEKITADFLESLTKEKLKKYTAAKSAIAEFKDSLQELASSMSEANKPLVFIIDELDRCRPDFSIEILEKSKHFFNVENIVFVLGIHKQQLGSSFKAVYGEGLEVDGYLRRFIDFEYKLPHPNKGAFSSVLLDKVFDHSVLEKNGDQYFKDYASNLIYVFELTLRDQEHCISLLELATRVSEPNDDNLPTFLFFLIVLKLKYTYIYTSFVTNRFDHDQLIAELKSQTILRPLFKSKLWQVLEVYIRTSMSDGKDYTDYRSALFSKDHNRQHLLSRSERDIYDEAAQLRALTCMKVVKHPHGTSGTLKYLVNKIDLAARFTT